jgi:hypothetical protein
MTKLADWYHDVNQRRLDLIHKKFLGGGLTGQEEAELLKVDKMINDEINRVFPPPDFDAIERKRKQVGKRLP